MMKRRYNLIPALALSLFLFACGNGGRSDGGRGTMSEVEKLKYDNTLKKVEAIYEKAAEAAADGNETAMAGIQDEIRRIKYDFSSDGMCEDDLQKCKELKERVNAMKDNPEEVFRGTNLDGADTGASSESGGCRGTLISRRKIKLNTEKRFPYYLNAGDNLSITLDCQGDMEAFFYDIHRQKCVKRWKINSPMSDSVAILKGGIYMLKLTPVSTEATAGVTLSYTGTDKSYRRRVRETLIECGKSDFLAMESDSIIVKKVFDEPKKIGLRGNLKSIFSGKSRVLVPVSVPSGCDVLLYSLRISTNEKTLPSDGKFAGQLSEASSRIKLFGVNVYEKRTLGSSIIERLLFNTRPPHEEDAYCNMYVLMDAAQAKKFQDESDKSGNYKYDVDQSQMGTQSCNGRLCPNGNKKLYLGFENEQMRYDNYIWLEMAALTYTKRYVRPVYMIR